MNPMRMSVLALFNLREFRLLPAFRTAVVHAVILDDPYLRRNKVHLPAYEFRSNLFQLGATLAADTFFFRNVKGYLLNRQTF